MGNSLVVQWLGLSAFPVVAQVQYLVGELRSHKPPGVAKKHPRNKTQTMNGGKRSVVLPH